LVPNHGKKHWKPSWKTWLPKVAQLMKNLHDRWKIEKEVKQRIKSWKFRLHNGWKVEKLSLQNGHESSNLCYDRLKIENCVCKRE
jgi:hypothetical protein